MPGCERVCVCVSDERRPAVQERSDGAACVTVTCSVCSDADKPDCARWNTFRAPYSLLEVPSRVGRCQSRALSFSFNAAQSDALTCLCAKTNQEVSVRCWVVVVVVVAARSTD